ncbi:hypothetical protein D3C86_2267450 [compost metagenome]
MGHCHRSAFFGFSLRNAFVCFRLLRLQIRADILTDIDIRNIYRENLKCGTGI